MLIPRMLAPTQSSSFLGVDLPCGQLDVSLEILRTVGEQVKVKQAECHPMCNETTHSSLDKSPLSGAGCGPQVRHRTGPVVQSPSRFVQCTELGPTPTRERRRPHTGLEQGRRMREEEEVYRK